MGMDATGAPSPMTALPRHVVEIPPVADGQGSDFRFELAPHPDGHQPMAMVGLSVGSDGRCRHGVRLDAVIARECRQVVIGRRLGREGRDDQAHGQVAGRTLEPKPRRAARTSRSLRASTSAMPAQHRHALPLERDHRVLGLGITEGYTGMRP